MKTAHTIGSEYRMYITFAETILQIIETVNRYKTMTFFVKSVFLDFVDYVCAVL